MQQKIWPRGRAALGFLVTKLSLHLDEGVPTVVDFVERGIDERRAADLHQRLKPFAEDWDRPEMDAYDAV